jgi:hypothetical protein
MCLMQTLNNYEIPICNQCHSLQMYHYQFYSHQLVIKMVKYLHKGHKINISFVKMISQYSHLKHKMSVGFLPKCWA